MLALSVPFASPIALQLYVAKVQRPDGAPLDDREGYRTATSSRSGLPES